MKKIDIYTDGACSGNPGRGGYGAILIYNGREKELSSGYKLTTNNRMEILGAIAALEALKESCRINLYSDSRYLVDAIEKGWVEKWKRNNWMRTKTEKALNMDLWIRLTEQITKHSIKFIWVKGHADNEFNERCDQLAREAIVSDDLLDDTGYYGKM